MNITVKKIAALILILATLFSLVSCTEKYNENNGDIAVTIGEEKISYDLYGYFYLMYKKQGIDDVGVEYSHDELTKMVENSLCEIVAAIEMADEYDIEVSEEQEDEIREYISSMKEAYESEEAFHNELKKNFMSEQVMFDIQYYTVLEANLREYLTSEQAQIIDFSDKALEKALETEFMAAVNILIFEDSEKDGLKGKALADSIYQQIVDGGDIYKLAEKYSDDNYHSDRYFAPNTTHEYFEEKVASLKIGEMSQVYKSELGYNITKRVEIDREYVDEYYEDLRDEFAYSRYLEIMDGKSEKLKLTYAEDFDISLITG